MQYGMRYLLKGIFNVAIGDLDNDGNQPKGAAEPDEEGKAKLEACGSLDTAAGSMEGPHPGAAQDARRHQGRVQGTHRGRRQGGREVIQGSPEWLAARCGCVTASEFSSVLAKGQGKTRAAYLRRVVAEMLTGKPTADMYKNAHMDRGHEQEPIARDEYEALTGEFVEQVGFIRHESLPVGCSPDGLIGADGGAEIKSVIPTVQLDTLLSGGYPPEHRPQVQGSLWLTKRAWWDFCSFSPDMPENLRLYVFRVHRDEEYIAKLEAEVTAFVREALQLRDLLLGRPVIEDALRASLARAA
jgi:hypothetical protein